LFRSIFSCPSTSTPAGWLFQDDAEQPLSILVPPNQPLTPRSRARERAEPPVASDIIGYEDAARSERTPHLIHFKAHVALGMQAVVDEQVDLP
jgi:hypothetical protein